MNALLPPDLRQAAAQSWERTAAVTDVELMLRLWHSIKPEDKDLALQMADADRKNAGVAK